MTMNNTAMISPWFTICSTPPVTPWVVSAKVPSTTNPRWLSEENATRRFMSRVTQATTAP